MSKAIAILTIMWGVSIGASAVASEVPESPPPAQTALPGNEPAAPDPAKLLQETERHGLNLIREGKYAEAAEVFDQLSQRPEANRKCAAIAHILADNPDGVYVLSDPAPAGALLLGNENSRPPGPAPLSDPIVLEAALTDLAKVDIEAGRQQMAKAVRAELTDANLVETHYELATEAFYRADALVAEIARSYRGEIARRRVDALHRTIESDSSRFDHDLSRLGRNDISAEAYRKQIARMIACLDEVHDGLNAILALAEPYPTELALEIQWAKLDLQRTERMRAVLAAELDED